MRLDKKILVIMFVLLALVSPTWACDYSTPAQVSVQSYSSLPAVYAPSPAVFAPYIVPTLQLTAPVYYGVQSYVYPVPVSTYGISSYGVSTSRIKISPFRSRVRVIVR